jgi:hypothetical protein
MSSAGYSRTPLIRKLGIKEGFRCRGIKAPEHFEELIGQLPQGARIASEINREDIREIGLQSKLVDVKVAALDEDWSGLKFVYRLKDR